RGGRMGHGIVRVDDIEPLRARDLDDLVGERQEILRLAEQRIRRRLDAVERQARLIFAQPGRRFAAPDVGVMTPGREHLAELGCHDPAASYRGITDDADVHGLLKTVERTTGSRTTKPSAHAHPASAPNCASRLSMSWRNSGVFSRVAAVPAPAGTNC